MQYILTLITDPETLILDDKVINKAIMAIERKGASVDNVAFLAKDRAVDIFYGDVAKDKVEKVLAEKLEKMAVDFVVQPQTDHRRKKLLISDMDSTIINQECIDEIAAKLDLKDVVALITERAMNGELDFKAALKERVALLANLPEESLQEVYDQNISFMSGARELVQTMKKNGSHAVLVSGGFTFFTSKVAEKIGFDEQFANTLEIKEGFLSGKVVEPILDSGSKLECLKNTIKNLGIDTEESIAVGDGANDLPMLKAAGTGVAYHAKPMVREQADIHINYTDLKSLLYIQGYKESEIENGTA